MTIPASHQRSYPNTSSSWKAAASHSSKRLASAIDSESTSWVLFLVHHAYSRCNMAINQQSTPLLTCTHYSMDARASRLTSCQKKATSTKQLNADFKIAAMSQPVDIARSAERQVMAWCKVDAWDRDAWRAFTCLAYESIQVRNRERKRGVWLSTSHRRPLDNTQPSNLFSTRPWTRCPDRHCGCFHPPVIR